jgi:flagellar biosynthesis protein FlhG
MMKSPAELDPYELLEVECDASPEEIERAYRLALATWGPGSLATYSLYTEDEVAALRERIELAFELLADPEARAAYDRGRAAAERAESGAQEASPEEAIEVDLDEIDLALESAPRPAALPVLEAFAEAPEEGGAAFDGPRLRRNRLQRGIELDQIARVTKVNPTYLRFIEEERFESLPAPVYVRGFVTAYARCLGLDPAHVVADYMERLEAARPAQPGGRFAGALRARR